MLEDMRNDAGELIRIAPPGNDPVSKSAMDLMGRKVEKDDNSYLAAVRQLDEQLSATITSLNDTVRAYRAQDEAGAHQLQRHRS